MSEELDLLNTFRPDSPFGKPKAIGETSDDLSGISPTGFVDSVLNEATNVTIDETGIDVTGGAITVTNPGATVIIDGTSNMFKIAATGTSSITGPTAGSATSNNVTVNTGFTYAPAFVAFLDITAVTANQLPHVSWNLSTGAWERNLYMKTVVVETSKTQVSVTWRSALDDSGLTYNYRYYILQEVAF